MNVFSVWKTAVVLPAALLAVSNASLAHTTGLSTSDLKWGTNGLQAEIILAGLDLTLALAHLETAAPLDANRDGKLTQEEIAGGLQRLKKFGADCLVVEFDGQRVSPGPISFSLDDKDNFRMEMVYHGARPARLRVRAALFAHLPADHMHFTAVHDAQDKPIGNKMLKPEDDALELTAPMAAAAPERPVSPFAGFFLLGVQHICTGYDHLLFLLALLLVCADFKSAVQVVTWFTVAHSITLALATLNLVRISNRLVECAVAASIIYVAVENLIRGGRPEGRWRVTFLFGLVHGVGFATVLQDLGVASSTTGITVPLVAFNLGVEFGQVIVVALVLPVIWCLRNYEMFLRRGVPACSTVVALLGGIWLAKRLFF